MREELTDLAAKSEPWCHARASYMLSVLDQLDAGTVTQAQVTEWMWDVLRQLNESATDESLRSRVEGMARHLGQLEI